MSFVASLVQLLGTPLPSLGWSPADLLLRSTAVLLIAAAARFVLRRRSAALHHVVGVLTFVALTALPVAMSVLPSDFGALPAVATWVDESPTLAQAGWRADDPMSPGSAGTAPEAVPAGRGMFRWLALAWAAGVLVALVRMADGQVFLAGAFARGREDAELTKALAAASRSHRLQRPVEVRMSSEVDVPLAFGALWPRVLVPTSARTWTAERLELVLLHEVGHLRRRDPATQLFSWLVSCFYWFHPLAWIAHRQLALDRERACDDLVLENRGDATRYASQLVSIAEALRGRRAPAMAVPMARPTQLRQRLTALLDSSADRRTMRLREIVLATVVTLVLLSPLGAVRASTGWDGQPLEITVHSVHGEPIPFTLGARQHGVTVVGAHEVENGTVYGRTPASLRVAPSVRALTLRALGEGEELALTWTGGGSLRTQQCSGHRIEMTRPSSRDAPSFDTCPAEQPRITRAKAGHTTHATGATNGSRGHGHRGAEPRGARRETWISSGHGGHDHHSHGSSDEHAHGDRDEGHGHHDASGHRGHGHAERGHEESGHSENGHASGRHDSETERSQVDHGWGPAPSR